MKLFQDFFRHFPYIPTFILFNYLIICVFIHVGKHVGNFFPTCFFESL